MKDMYKALLFLAIFSPGSASGYEFSPASAHEQHCYGRAMIGLDSVINSRLGVPAEHALDLATISPVSFPKNTKVYSKALLRTIWNAYAWQKSPHEYAISVFYRCAREKDNPLHSARNDWLVAEQP